jgi:hypothetical protein
MRGLPAYGVQRRANSLGVLRQRDSDITTPSLLDGLVAYWKLDEGSGTRIDSAGSNNLTDNNTVGNATGKIGNAADFIRANSEYLAVALDKTNYTTISFSFWFYIDADFPTTGIVSWSVAPNTTTPFLQLSLDSGTIRLYVDADFRVTKAIALNTWYHAVILYNGTAWKLYLNNVLEGTYTGAYGSLPVITLFLGTGYNGYFDGKLDEFGIWNRALTASEIAILYNSGAGITFPF